MRTFSFNKPVTAVVALVALFVAGDFLLGSRPLRADDPKPAGGKSGNELWAENCGSCHYSRSPATYTPAQWEVADQHMRLIANLTEEDTKKITEFLKASSQ